jgi:type III secretion protein J
MGRGSHRGLVLLAASWLVGCTAPVAHGLDEHEANGVAVALERAGIDAQKEVDPTAEGKFRVLVARDDSSAALGVLREEELPRPKPKGLLEAMGQGSLVPSRATEHAQYLAGLSGDLEKTLLSVDGVLAARVHLQVPEPDPLRPAGAEKATASVLVEHRGATPPLASDALARLVAGGVPALAADQVSVVQIARPARAEGAETRLRHVGPLAVAQSSLRPLQLGFGGLIALVVVQAIAVLALMARLSRLRHETGAGRTA